MNLVGIVGNGGRPRLQVRVSGDITGTVDMWEIVRIDADNAIRGTVRHNPVGVSDPPALGFVGAYDIYDTTAAIVAERGDITRVQSDRDLRASVTAKEGSIMTVQAALSGEGVINGAITALNGSITMITSGLHIGPGIDFTTPVKVQARDGIGRIESGFEMHIDLTANANGGSGDLGQMLCNGDLFGSIRANSLGDDDLSTRAIDVYGNLDADITLTGSVHEPVNVRASFLAGRTFKIGDTLDSGTTLAFGTFGGNLAGQVIINSGFQGGQWLGGVGGDSVALEPVPFYNNTGIGGGAVGLAPFNVHQADCVPEGGDILPASQTPTKALLRHYGPVFALDLATQPPLTVLCRQFPIPGAWLDITGDFSIAVHPDGNLREVQLTEKAGAVVGFAPGFEYQVRPVTDPFATNPLRCLQVSGTPPVYPYVYGFAVAE